MWKEYLNAFLGVCLAIAAFVLTADTLLWTVGILGAVILIVALVGETKWQDYTNAALGLLAAVLVFVGIEAVTLAWTLAGVGALVLILAVWDAAELSVTSGSTVGHA